MPDGIDLRNANPLVQSLRDKLPSNPLDLLPKPQQQTQWGIWEKTPQAQQQNPAAQRPSEVQMAPPQQQVTLRPEQMVGTNRADAGVQNNVNRFVEQAQRQGNRQTAASMYVNAIQTADASRDGTLQAYAKVEYGLANMNWGFSEEGFKWILEAGSNNPNIYNPQQNGQFLKRLQQAGLPQGAVDSLLKNGQNDPNWYLKVPDATKQLDKSMTGAVFIAPNLPGGDQNQNGGDRFGPPSEAPEQRNPAVLQGDQKAGPWAQQLFGLMLKSAQDEKDIGNSFNLYKQAVAKADEFRDPSMQAQSRIELGLAVVSWGNPQAGFKWILDAGSKNPAIYDSRVNQGLINRLKQGGIPDAAIDMLMAKGQRNPNWYLRDPESAAKLEATMKQMAPARTNEEPRTNYPGQQPVEQTRPQFPTQKATEQPASSFPWPKPAEQPAVSPQPGLPPRPQPFAPRNIVPKPQDDGHLINRSPFG